MYGIALHGDSRIIDRGQYEFIRRDADGRTTNNNAQELSGRSHTEVVTDVLVIGGYAGIFATIKVREAGKKGTIVEKGAIFKSGLSPFAGGFRYFSKTKNDAKELWAGSSQVGNYISNKDYYDMWGGTPNVVIYEELKSWNFFIPQDKEYCNIARRKVLESGANAIERTMVTHLINEGDHIAGAAEFSIDAEELIVIKAKAVILCSGAGAFKSPGFYSNSLTSDGDLNL